MFKLLIVQPVLASYRVPIVKALACSEAVDDLVVYSDTSEEFGYVEGEGLDLRQAGWRCFLGFIYHPSSLFSYCRTLHNSSHIIHFADFKYTTLWIGLVLSKILGREFYVHGQGGYKGRASFFKKMIYTVAVSLSSGYICYTEFSKNSIKNLVPYFLYNKISVVDNSLYMVSENLFDVTSNGLFYVGRLREGCGIELALKAAESLGITMHVIGDGEYLEQLKKKYLSAYFYGAVFDVEQQKKIASLCMAGIYGGDAGLSVVHYMAWGLPVIVHSSMAQHMGPEPSYICDKYNGLLFNREDLNSLKEVVKSISVDLELREKLSLGALNTFSQLSNPPMHAKFLKILEGEG